MDTILHQLTRMNPYEFREKRTNQLPTGAASDIAKLLVQVGGFFLQFSSAPEGNGAPKQIIFWDGRKLSDLPNHRRISNETACAAPAFPVATVSPVGMRNFLHIALLGAKAVG